MNCVPSVSDGCDLCRHDEAFLIQDEVSGDEICSQCGLVLGRLLGEVRPLRLNELDNYAAAAEPSNAWQTLIVDLCHTLHLDGQYTIQKAMHLTEIFKHQLLERKGIQIIMRHLAAYSICHILLDNASSFTLSDVAKLTDMSTRKLWYLEKLLRHPKYGGVERKRNVANDAEPSADDDDDEPCERPEQYVQNFCFYLDIPRKDAAHISKALRMCRENLPAGSRPKNVAAATMLIYGMKKYNTLLTLGRISQMTHVSQGSILRLSRKMKLNATFLSILFKNEPHV